MTRTGRRNSNRAIRRLVGAAVLVLAVSVGLFTWLGLRINLTSSLPVGVYIATGHGPARGRIAEFCPSGGSEPESVRYRSFGLACHDRAVPLLKPVVAIAGDVVTVSAAGLSVNGRPLPNTAPLTEDSHGRPLRPWTPGTYVVPPGAVVLASSYHPGSYDSRYLGLVPTRDIMRMVRPLWVYDTGGYDADGRRVARRQQARAAGDQ